MVALWPCYDHILVYSLNKNLWSAVLQTDLDILKDNVKKH